MKTIKAISSVFLMTLFIATSTKAENKNTSEKTYTIEEATNSSSSSGQYIEVGSTYKIHFESLDTPMNVTVNTHKGGTDFIVTNHDFEVMYQLRGNAFGVTYVNEHEASISKEEMYKKINRKSFLFQKVITQTPKSENEYIQLIASYVPDLIK